MDLETLKYFWPAIVGGIGSVWWWWRSRAQEEVTLDQARARGAEVSVNAAHTVVHMLTEQLDSQADRLAACETRNNELFGQLVALRTEFEEERVREKRRFHGVQRQLSELRRWAEHVVAQWPVLRLSETPPPLPDLTQHEEP